MVRCGWNWMQQVFNLLWGELLWMPEYSLRLFMNMQETNARTIFFCCCCCCFTSASHTVMALSASSNIEMTVMSCILNAFLLHHSCAIHESVWLFFVGSGIIHLELCIMRQSLRVCVWGVNVFHCSMYVVWHEAKNADNHDNKKQTSSNQQLGASFSLLLGT